MLKHISEYIPEAVRKLTGQELAGKTVAEIFPSRSDSIYGDFDGVIKGFDHAENLIEIADISREIGLNLSNRDKEIEKNAFELLRKFRKQKTREVQQDNTRVIQNTMRQI